ncbi:hypothetical protein PRIPAC_94596 [Pristionchus pacificus]|uniref:Uncharacterized protein n=1 Tax=Pristionchus pacificus TaxID=54126 RepID=A0A454XMI7_PRIPA|nr:hypothetical protein PRIPAC_94596 [Pristionchus pacificus]|eukprot:PDM77507.1 hypothetical protein PRIPAC_34374 [Pristionchus pacificus]
MDIEYEVDAILCLNVASNKILADLQQLPTTLREDQQHRKKEYEEIASILASHVKMQNVILALWKIDLFFESHKSVKDEQILEDAAQMHDQYIGDMVRRFCQFRLSIRSVLNKLAFHTMQKEGTTPQ